MRSRMRMIGDKVHSDNPSHMTSRPLNIEMTGSVCNGLQSKMPSKLQASRYIDAVLE